MLVLKQGYLFNFCGFESSLLMRL